MNKLAFFKGVCIAFGLLAIFLLVLSNKLPQEVLACGTPRPTCTPKPTVSPSPEPTATPLPTDSPTSQSGTGGLSAAGAPVCSDSKPDAPYLVSATILSGNKVELVWQKVAGADDYTISYGPNSGNYLYGVPSTGDTDNFTINDFSHGCFVVRAVNGCMPGDPSNEVCSGATASQVLGASTMADTGTNKENLYYFILFLGIELMMGGIISYAKDK